MAYEEDDADVVDPVDLSRLACGYELVALGGTLLLIDVGVVDQGFNCLAVRSGLVFAIVLWRRRVELSRSAPAVAMLPFEQVVRE